MIKKGFYKLYLMKSQKDMEDNISGYYMKWKTYLKGSFKNKK